MQSLAFHGFSSQLQDFVSQTQCLIYNLFICVCVLTAIVEVVIWVQNLTLPPEDVPSMAAQPLMTSNTYSIYSQHTVTHFIYAGLDSEVLTQH